MTTIAKKYLKMVKSQAVRLPKEVSFENQRKLL